MEMPEGYKRLDKNRLSDHPGNLAYALELIKEMYEAIEKVYQAGHDEYVTKNGKTVRDLNGYATFVVDIRDKVKEWK